MEKSSKDMSAAGQYQDLREVLDLEDHTSNFGGLSPDLQLLWRVLLTYGREVARMQQGIADMRKDMREILKALADKAPAVPDDLEAAIKEDERLAKVRAKYPNATNQSIG